MRRRSILLALITLLLTAAACSSSSPEPLHGPFPIYPGTDLVVSGQRIYAANCYHCHGDATRRPITPNTPAHTEDGHTWHHPDRQLVQWVLDGVPRSISMPRFRGLLSEDEVRAAIAYLKTFWSPQVQAQQLQSSLAYEQQVGSVVPRY